MYYSEILSVTDFLCTQNLIWNFGLSRHHILFFYLIFFFLWEFCPSFIIISSDSIYKKLKNLTCRRLRATYICWVFFSCLLSMLVFLFYFSILIIWVLIFLSLTKMYVCVKVESWNDMIKKTKTKKLKNS